MKKILLLALLMNCLIFAGSLKNIDNLSAIVNEKVVVNKNIKEKSYSFSIKYPDKVYKEMISPKINLGEKYIYNGDKKLVYYPLLKDSFVEKISDDENYILQALKAIKAGKNPMKMENGEIKELKLDEEVKIIFSDYKNITGLNFPLKAEIYQEGKLYSTLIFSQVKINESIDEKLFKIN